MFKFAQLVSGGGKFVHRLSLHDKHIGTCGLDEEGLWIKTNHKFTLAEISLFIAQTSISDPALLSKPIEFLPLGE